MNALTLRIGGMHCDGCAARVKTVLERAPGVRRAEVSFPRGEAEIRFDSNAVEETTLAGLVESAGFEPGPIAKREETAR